MAGIEGKTGSPPKVCQLNTEQGVIISVSLKTFFTGHNPRWQVFGENRYLLQQLEHHFRDITIQQPTRAWSAVCRGAVYRGLYGGDQIVSNHISKYFYRCLFNADWEDGKFAQEDKGFDQRSQKWIARGQVEWYLRKVRNLQLPL